MTLIFNRLLEVVKIFAYANFIKLSAAVYGLSYEHRNREKKAKT